MNSLIEVRQYGDGWEVVEPGRARYGYRRLADAIRRAGQMIEDPRSEAKDWRFVDEFMTGATEVAHERARIAEADAAIVRRTEQQIVTLALNGLSNGDIAAALGITPARVSQLVKESAEWLWGEDDPSGEIQYVKLLLNRGWRAGRGRGPLPDKLIFAGQVFVPTGGAGAVEGRPWRHTYVLPEMLRD